jgi:ribonuclease-3
VAHALYTRHPDFSEGKLAKVRSHVVSRATCAGVARELGLGQRLVAQADSAQTADELEQLSRNRNVLAAVIEAALGALFLQHGFAAIEDAVVAAFSEPIEHALTSRVDHKTDLQELLARSGRQVTYVDVSVEGPPHERRFTCAAVIEGEEFGRGEGRTKKAAEQEAAREALARLENDAAE